MQGAFARLISRQDRLEDGRIEEIYLPVRSIPYSLCGKEIRAIQGERLSTYYLRDENTSSRSMHSSSP